MVGYQEMTREELKARVKKAKKRLNPCEVCPRECGVDRSKKKAAGFCRMGRKARVFGAHPHWGEEGPLVAGRGSGTIFFSSCNLACVFCQNWRISQKRQGREVGAEELAEMMIRLQDKGCVNINLVSPSIWVPQILEALLVAKDKGLRLPLVYNTGGYDAVESLKLLERVVDIYMPDIKYGEDKKGARYSQVADYWQVVQEAVREMHEQVGDLVIDDQGRAVKGLLIRHLVLPEGLAGTEQVMQFIASLSKDSYVNIMDQYRPAHKADQYPELDRGVSRGEVEEALKLAREAGLARLGG